jgi:hypothetical protein
MKYARWKQLSEEERQSACQQLDPIEDWDLFKQVEQEFLGKFGGPKGVETAFCGICGTVGPLNAIAVQTRAGGAAVKLPKQFMGFPVIRQRRRSPGGARRR